MEDLARIYRGSFFATRLSVRWVSEALAGVVAETFRPETVLDVGCANGYLVKELLDRGVDAYGIEGCESCAPYFEVPDRIWIIDLRFPMLVEGALFDLVVSTEVAEHIEPEHADTFVDTLIAFSDRIVMTAAPPGQKGTYHVNCQPPEYWVAKFAERGFHENADMLATYRGHMQPWVHKRPFSIYHRNALYFER